MMRIGLFGGALGSVNFGVSALTYSQIQLLETIKTSLNVELEYYLFAEESEETMKCAQSFFPSANIVSKYTPRLKTGIVGLYRLRKDICSCDVVIDMTYGDSFSDIYGMKNYILYAIPKIIAINTRKPLILAPQTYGPFYSRLTKLLSTWIIKRSSCIVARDFLSIKCINECSDKVSPILSSDLAMQLPYREIKKDNYDNLQIGLNVSSLLWNNDNRKTKLNVNIPYQELVIQLIEELEKTNNTIHLVTHVYSEGLNSEYQIAERLHNKYPNSTVLAPVFSTPMEAKTYFSNLDVLIGSRMHATIGAFSAGVPVIPISYSRKFEGLYGTIGYNYVVDCSKENVRSAVLKIMNYIQSIDELRLDREKAFHKAISMNSNYIVELTKILKMNSHVVDDGLERG